MRFIFVKISSLVLFVSMSGCYLNSSDSGSGTTPTDFVSFETDVTPIFDKQLNNNVSCTQTACHIGTGASAGLNLSVSDTDVNAVYAEVTPELEITTPESSPLLMKATNETSHSGGNVMDKGSDDYNTILKWITDGAFNDNCTGVPASFATNVTPIFTQCTTVGCHDTVTPVLSTNPYQNIQDAGAVNTTHPSTSSLLRKPLGLDSHGGSTIFTAGVTDPNYKTIFCWIKNGAKDD